MLALGRLHRQGLGVLQDFVEAHKWFNLAASRGETEAAKERDALAARMTPRQTAEAQERAAAWRPGVAAPAKTPDSADAPQQQTAEAAPARTPESTDPPPQRQTAETAPVETPDSADPPPRAIREAQELLAGLGYDPGGADGRWGPRTARAHAAFLRDVGLPASAVLTPDALNAMRSAADARGIVAGASGSVGGPAGPAGSRSPDALHRAVLAGDVEGLEALLAADVEVDRRDGRGMTALMHAADNGRPLLAGPLLASNADPNVRAPDGATALFMAAAQGHTEVVAQLMRAGAEVSAKGPQGMTATDVARLTYGETAEAGATPELRALLRGRTWEEEEREEERRRLAVLTGMVGTKLRDCDRCPEMVVAPAGSFAMGSPPSEEGRDADEGPVRTVTIDLPFAVGVHVVRPGEYARFVSATGHGSGDGCWVVVPSEGGQHTWKENAWRKLPDGGWRSPGFEQTDDHPVVCVSRDDARAYARWLSEETGQAYRLPSEAEWEYAARAGTRTPFHTGPTISTDQANFIDGTGPEGRARWQARETTVPVGAFPANGFGLHDGHGNVWEWTEDCWNWGYRGAPTDGSARKDGDCGMGVRRGGGWRVYRQFDRSDMNFIHRSANRGTERGGVSDTGFRVVRTLAP